MSDRIRLLGKFLDARARDRKLAKEALSNLALLYGAARTGQFQLGDHRRVNRTAVAESISSATGREVDDVAVISLSGQGPKPAITSAESYMLSQGLKTGDSLWQALWTRQRRSYEHSLDSTIGDKSVKLLQTALRRSIGDGLERAVWKALDKRTWIKHRACIWDGIWDCLNYYVGFAMTGRTDRVDELEPLITTLGQALPLCDRQEDPGSWIVLVS